MTEDLKQIKKIYGEKMMHFCRAFFSGILEEEGMLVKLLQDSFAPSHELYEDLINNNLLDDFKNYIYDLFHKEEFKLEILDVRTPQELMRQAGYILYECKTESDIQAFKKYYARGEELCTFNGNRLNSCYVFFAIKENVDEINRTDFKNPERQDEYGTSVISIQFSRDAAHTLSIKNRYNHTVVNPDSTFSNNLDNIIEGLTKSFEEFYGLKQKHKSDGFEIPGYVKANDGKWYKYNYEINNIYYCPDNITIENGEVKRYPKEKYIIMDYFILDLTQKTISLYDMDIGDSFPYLIGRIKKIIVEKKGEEKEIIIINDKDEEIVIILDKNNNIIGLKSEAIRQVEDNFLVENVFLATLELPHLRQAGNEFLYNNNYITILDLPELEEVGGRFLEKNYKSLTTVKLPKLQKAGEQFLCSNRLLTTLSLPSLQQVGDYFMISNEKLSVLEAPNLQQVGCNFLELNNSLTDLCLPKLQEVKDSFFHFNSSIRNLDLPNLQEVGNSFLCQNESLVSLNMPSLRIAGDSFLHFNKNLSSAQFPALQQTGSHFLCNNRLLTTLSLPSLQQIGDFFLYKNETLLTLKVPTLRKIGDGFLSWNEVLSDMECPSLQDVAEDFWLDNALLREKVIKQIEENQGIKK